MDKNQKSSKQNSAERLKFNFGRRRSEFDCLSLETDNSLLIIDEKKGRRIAQELGLKIIGTLGVILQAKERGLINSMGDLLAKLENADFRISQSLKAKILEND